MEVMMDDSVWLDFEWLPEKLVQRFQNSNRSISEAVPGMAGRSDAPDDENRSYSRLPPVALPCSEAAGQGRPRRKSRSIYTTRAPPRQRDRARGFRVGALPYSRCVDRNGPPGITPRAGFNSLRSY